MRQAPRAQRWANGTRRTGVATGTQRDSIPICKTLRLSSCCTFLGAPAVPIRERTRAGRLRYQQDYWDGKVGKTVYSRFGKNLPVERPKRIFNRERVIELRRQGASIRTIGKQLGVGVGTVTRILQGCTKNKGSVNFERGVPSRAVPTLPSPTCTSTARRAALPRLRQATPDDE